MRRFPAHALPSETKNWEVIQELCPYADDIWIKIMATMNDISIVAVKENQSIKYIANSQEETLWSINSVQNDVQFKSLIEHYKDSNIIEKIKGDCVSSK